MSALKYTVLGFAPGLFWLWYFRRKDDLEPEPRSLVIRVFALGCASAFLVLWVRPLFDPLAPAEAGWHRDLVDAFLITAVIEESAKLLAFLIGAFFHRELDEPLDGVVYGMAAALGFASVENVVYLVSTGDPGVVVMRAFTATLAHVGFTGSLCFSLALARLGRRHGILIVAGAWLGAVVFHGTYDLFLFRGEGYRWLSLLGMLPLTLVLLGLKIRWARARSPLFHPDLAARPDPPGRKPAVTRNPSLP